MSSLLNGLYCWSIGAYSPVCCKDFCAKQKIRVFAHLDVVDIPLETEPLQQDLFLYRNGVTTKFIAYLHK